MQVKEADVGGFSVAEGDDMDKLVGKDAEDDSSPDPLDEVKDYAAAFE